jgi:hypothetical protein
MGHLSPLERRLFVNEEVWHNSREPTVNLPLTFESAKDYCQALLSLVLEEAREHVLSGLTRSKGELNALVVTRSLKVAQRPVGH